MTDEEELDQRAENLRHCWHIEYLEDPDGKFLVKLYNSIEFLDTFPISCADTAYDARGIAVTRLREMAHVVEHREWDDPPSRPVPPKELPRSIFKTKGPPKRDNWYSGHMEFDDIPEELWPNSDIPKKLVPVLRRWRCPECAIGHMVTTGVHFPTAIPGHHHECNCCGYMTAIEDKYPRIIYVKQSSED